MLDMRDLWEHRLGDGNTCLYSEDIKDFKTYITLSLKEKWRS